MYLPTDLPTILELCIRKRRETRDFWRDVMQDNNRARQEDAAIWALMDVRSAMMGKAATGPFA